MKCVMQQLRASREEWAENDRVVPAGAIALIDKGEGSFDMKVGDGEHPFSALNYLGSRIIKSDASSVTLSHGDDVRLGRLSELSISFDENFGDDFYAMLTFDSSSDGTMIMYPEEMRCTGTSCYYGYFSPDMECHYTLVFWYDGRLQCSVRGIYDE